MSCFFFIKQVFTRLLVLRLRSLNMMLVFLLFGLYFLLLIHTVFMQLPFFSLRNSGQVNFQFSSTLLLAQKRFLLLMCELSIFVVCIMIIVVYHIRILYEDVFNLDASVTLKEFYQQRIYVSIPLRKCQVREYVFP